MSFISSEPVISGVPYAVSRVANDEQPGSLDQFVGDVSFTVKLHGAHLVCGFGAFDGKSVRFYEKDQEGSGKDIRVWRVTAALGGVFVATHEAAW